MTAAIAIVAFVFGAIAGYLLAERRWRGAAANLQTAAALAEQRQTDLAQQLSAEKTQTQALREQLSAAQSDLAAERARFDAAQAALRDTFASVSSEALERNSERLCNWPASGSPRYPPRPAALWNSASSRSTPCSSR